MENANDASFTNKQYVANWPAGELRRDHLKGTVHRATRAHSCTRLRVKIKSTARSRTSNHL